MSSTGIYVRRRLPRHPTAKDHPRRKGAGWSNEFGCTLLVNSYEESNRDGRPKGPAVTTTSDGELCGPRLGR